jgi:hypothetical protein
MTTSQEEVLTYNYQYHRAISRYDFGPTRPLLCCRASTRRYILSLAAIDVLVKGKIPSRHPWRFFRRVGSDFWDRTEFRRAILKNFSKWYLPRIRYEILRILATVSGTSMTSKHQSCVWKSSWPVGFHKEHQLAASFSVSFLPSVVFKVLPGTAVHCYGPPNPSLTRLIGDGIEFQPSHKNGTAGQEASTPRRLLVGRHSFGNPVSMNRGP